MIFRSHYIPQSLRNHSVFSSDLKTMKINHYINEYYEFELQFEVEYH